jgi:fluoride exporter
VPTEPIGPSDPDAVVDSDLDLGDPAQVAELRPREWDILVAVGIGGVLGAQARYGLGRAIPHGPSALPWSTVLINASGCLAIGILMAVLLAQASPPRLARPFLGVGILGGYTTYSSFATDTVALLARHRPALAVAYLAITVVSCAVAVWLGSALTRRLIGDRS